MAVAKGKGGSNLIVKKEFYREGPLRPNGTLSKQGARGDDLLWSGQAGHGWAGHWVLFSLLGSLEKVQDSAGIILWPLLVGVVAAFGENSQFAPWEVAVKSS